jgi:hypothetical protein
MPFAVHWDAEHRLLATHVWGGLAVDEVAQLVAELSRAMAAIPAQSGFIWLSDATGYEPLADRAGHAALRAVVPRALAAHGFRTSLLELAEGAELELSSDRGVVCRAVAHVHHDADKMAQLDQQLGGASERYFGDLALARAWLATR